MLCLRCIIAHKALFSLSFCYENMAMKVPHFHSKIQQSLAFSALWHTVGFHACVYDACQHACAKTSQSPPKNQAC